MSCLHRSITTGLLLVACLLASLRAQATMVRLFTVLGPVDVALYDNSAPLSVANFLAYVGGMSYDGTFIQRSDLSLGVIQGGGYAWIDGLGPIHIPIAATTVPLEYSAARPNVRGSIALARASAPNSASSEWFVNLVDNTVTLGAANGGGYAVFGQVTTPGMAVVDAIAALRRASVTGTPFTTLPLAQPVTDGIVRNANLVLITAARVLAAPASDADRAFNYLEATYAAYLQPTGSEQSGTGVANGVAYYYRYYANSNAYVGVGVADNIVYYLVPAVNNAINRYDTLAHLLPIVAAAGY